MAQPSVVGVHLDKPRLLFYGIADVVEAERRMAKSLVRAMSERMFGDLVILLWAGLRHEDAKLTPERVMKGMDAARERDATFMLWDKVAEGLVDSGHLPSPEATKAPEGVKAPDENPT